VPTRLPIDEVCTFEELADPLEALLPIPDGAIRLLEAVHDVAGDGPDGFRASQLIEERDDGTIANNKRGLHRLARLSALDVTYQTVARWVNELVDLRLIRPAEYEQRRGYATPLILLL